MVSFCCLFVCFLREWEGKESQKYLRKCRDWEVVPNNLIKASYIKQNKQMSKIEPEAWNMEQTDRSQREGGRGITVERKGGDWSKDTYE